MGIINLIRNSPSLNRDIAMKTAALKRALHNANSTYTPENTNRYSNLRRRAIAYIGKNGRVGTFNKYTKIIELLNKVKNQRKKAQEMKRLKNPPNVEPVYLDFENMPFKNLKKRTNRRVEELYNPNAVKTYEMFQKLRFGLQGGYAVSFPNFFSMSYKNMLKLAKNKTNAANYNAAVKKINQVQANQLRQERNSRPLQLRRENNLPPNLVTYYHGSKK